VRIGYLCSEYPGVSHTFVLREVNALRKLGLEIDTFSIRRAGSILSEADRIAYETTFAILPARATSLLGAHLRLLLSKPRAYLATLAVAWRLAPPGLRGRLWQLFYFIEAVILWLQCEQRGIRHVHVHLANVAADVALLAAHLGSEVDPLDPWSWSLTIHGPFEFYDVSRFRVAEKVRRARFVVCISDYARSQLMALSAVEEWGKLHVIHVGIPIAQFTRNGAAREADEILFIGRLVAVKGQAVLLEAVALLTERGIPVNVVMAGEGPEREGLEGLAASLGLGDRVAFPGAVGQDDIHALYASATIFCLPSFAEGIPGVLMEAMAMGLPVISTRITGVPELVEDGHNGLLVAPGRVDQLADALARLLLDSQLREQFGAAGREKVLSEFNTDSSAEAMYELILRALGETAATTEGAAQRT
jgi:colanic acid/amylovoran biosynthesis glycosyltransferase